MTLHLPDFVRATIDGTDRTDYVISYNRQSSLCTFSDTFTLEISHEIPAIPDPYDPIVIRELYAGENQKVIGGYIVDITQNFETGAYLINGQDKTLLLDDYFIYSQYYANNESVIYWINWYANLVGLDVQYDASYLSQYIVEAGTPMGMITASEGLALLERLAAVYIKYDAEVDKLVVFRFTSSEPTINITNNQATSFERSLGTDKTRNVVKVYGGYRYNIFTGEASQVFAKARTEIPELITDKTVVLANPFIKRTPVAEIVASRILEIVDDLDDIVDIETHGFYPQIDAGEVASINIGRGNFTYHADRQITTIQTNIDENGAITLFIVGEKCPRVSILPPLSVVYATATNAGVLVSWDGGDIFDPFNKGIVGTEESSVGSGINGLSIAANKYGQLMAIVDNNIYKRVGKYDSWSQVTTLDNPSNDEGEYQHSVTVIDWRKAEKEANKQDHFHLLGRITSSGGIVPPGQERWWVYWTKDFGNIWDSMQLYVPGSGVPIGTPSGLPRGLINGLGITQTQLQAAATISGAVTWNVTAHDIEGAVGGNVTVLLEGQPGFYMPPDKDKVHSIYIAYPEEGNYPTPGQEDGMVLGYWDLTEDGGGSWYRVRKSGNWNNKITMGNDNTIFSVPHDTRKAIAFMRDVIGGAGSANWWIYRTLDGGATGFWECGLDPGGHYDAWPGTNIADGDQTLSVLHDWRSLQPNQANYENIIRFAIIAGYTYEPDTWDGDDITNNYIKFGAMFYEIDITKAANVCMETWFKELHIGTGGDYEWSDLNWIHLSSGAYNYPRKPKRFCFGTSLAASHRGGGGQAAAITTHLNTVDNKGYYFFCVRDRGTNDGWYYEGDPPSWNYYSNLDDYEEFFNMGAFIIELDFVDHTLSLHDFSNLQIASYAGVPDNAKDNYNPDRRTSPSNSSHTCVNTVGNIPYCLISHNDYIPAVGAPGNPHPEEGAYAGRDTHEVIILQNTDIVGTKGWPYGNTYEPINTPNHSNGHINIPYYTGNAFVHFSTGADVDEGFIMVKPGYNVEYIDDSNGNPLNFDEYGIFRINPANSYYGIISRDDGIWDRFQVYQAQRASPNRYTPIASGWSSNEDGRYIGMDARTNENGQFYITASGTGF